MTDHQLQIVLCGSDKDAAVFRAAGLRSVRVVNDTKSIFVRDEGSFEVDPTLRYFGTVVLAFPPESERLRDAIAVRLGDTKCRWIEWPVEGPSPDEVLPLIASARPMWIDEICTMADIPAPPPQQTFVSGFDKLDQHGFRFVRPALMAMIGPYGSGKSVLARQLACNLWRLHRWRVLITALEERVRPRYQRDLPRHIIDHSVSLWTDADVANADAQIQQGFRFLRRKRNTLLDGNRLMDRIEFAVRVYGVDVVIIDPINEIDHQVPKGESKTDYLGRFIMGLKQLADDYDLLMIVCAHPPKDGVEKRTQKGRLLTLNDAADTAHYGNKADIGWCVWSPLMVGPTYLHVDKVKDTEVMGDPTLARLHYDSGMGRFVVTQVGYDEVMAEVTA
jgi:twinkle protein